MFVEYIYMNSTTPKRHAETLRNRNIPFQLKKRNIYRNGIDNLGSNKSSIRGRRYLFFIVTLCSCLLIQILRV